MEEVMKKGLPATPSGTRHCQPSYEDCTYSDICIYVDHINPVVIARSFSALPPCDYCNIRV
ncbi:MAG: hypothetical protein H6Q93_1155 [Nitrospirae bacterium]|nr:hypothetical protein [Nitrospirota bacterium]